MHGEGAVTCEYVSKRAGSRPVVVPIFGNRLLELRGGRSAEIVIRRMRTLGVTLTASTLYQYEAGTVNAPDPGVLWALGKIYQVPVDELIAVLVLERGGGKSHEADLKLINTEEQRLRRIAAEFDTLHPKDQDVVRHFIVSLRSARTKKVKRRAITA